ncbi:MAG TPA: hypothetical protein VMZ30_18205 [Pyrinomonadaceae bacterium]|nr:hypothetical protein [Pyrinomonadaceae bacterium]
MVNHTMIMLAVVLGFVLAPVVSTAQFAAGRSSSRLVGGVGPQAPGEIETTYDEVKDKTTVKLARMKIWSGQGKYVSLYMTPSFSFPGRRLVTTPAIIDFELHTVVRNRLRTDLYVIFLIDGEKIFLSSSRWAIKRPVPGRVWMGEGLVFRMPYETFVKITKATTFEIKFDATSFSVGDKEKQALRDFLIYTKPYPQITRITQIQNSKR